MKFHVTPELAKTMKTLRVQKGISSRDVAACIGKSPSYVSKLEGGDVKYIAEETCTALLTFVAGGGEFYDEVLSAVFDVLKFVAEDGAMREQLWFMHYDVNARPVVISEGMAADMADSFAAVGATPKSIAAQINANIDSEMSPSFPANEMLLVEGEDTKRLMARVDISEAEVTGMLEAPGHTTCYFYLYNVVHTMLRMRLYPGATAKLPSDDAALLLRLTSQYLQQWDVHSLMGYSRYVASDEFIERQSALVGTEGGVVEKVAARLQEIMDYDALGTACQLMDWLETLSWDPAFALKVASLPFPSLGELSHTNKTQLIADIEALLEKYDQMDDFQKRAERY